MLPTLGGNASMAASRRHFMHRALLVVLLILAGLSFTGAQSRTVEWTHYSGNAASQKYSPLDQINKDTIGKLQVAWRWASPDNAVIEANPTSRPGAYNDTPLMVKGVLYTVTSLGQIAAINPATGESLWVFDPASWKTGRPGNLGFVHRGIAFWSDPSTSLGQAARRNGCCSARNDAYLISVDAKTGALDPAFGDGGKIDLMDRRGARRARDELFGERRAGDRPRRRRRRRVSIHDGPTHKEWPRGDINGFDVRTGKKLWTLHSIPQKGEFGNDTWGDDSWTYTGSTNVWTNMSADEELGYVYLPFGTPTDDFYGGHRPGANLFAESLVALDAKTGKRVVAFPGRASRRVGLRLSRRRRSSSTSTSTASRSRPWRRSASRASPTCSIAAPARRSGRSKSGRCRNRRCRASARIRRSRSPRKPPAFERQGVTEADLIDFTPELKEAALDGVEGVRLRSDLHAAVGEGNDSESGMGRRRELGRARRSIPRPARCMCRR